MIGIARRRIIMNSNYTRLAYIESTGTQYIDTGVKLYETGTANCRVEMKVSVASSNSRYATVLNAMEEISPYPGFVIRTDNDNKVHGDDSENKPTDTTIFITHTANESASHNVSTTLFAGYNRSGNPQRYCKMKLYYCKIYNNDILVRDYIPVLCNGVACLYDRISANMFYNNGIGSFIAGKLINGHEYVDLGLPSGLLWAVCNIGAEEETGYGNRFQWGDTQGYSTSQIGSGTGQKSFNWKTYKYGSGESSPGAKGMTKYNSTDGLTVLEASDDAAVANMGGGWRMPTVNEIIELVNNTTCTRVTINGVSGLRIENSSNSFRYIFIPDAGYYADTTLYNENQWSTAWLTNVSSSDKRYSRILSYESDGFHTGRTVYRRSGLPIRGVHAAVI